MNPTELASTTPTTEQHLTSATDAAAGAAKEMAATLPAERATWLLAAAAALDDAADELTTLADEETALGRPRLMGEIGRTSGQLRLFAEVIREGSCFDVTIDSADPGATPPRPELRRMLHPLGPVAVFAAGNFPFAFSVAGGDTASALAAGCPVIVKAHPGHPRTSRRTAAIVGEALRSSGAPDGALAVVEGLQVGRELVTHPIIQAVGFTGSLRGGRALFDLAVGRPDPIPFYGELGSLNPVVISVGAAAARPDDLATGLVGSMTLGVGQFCTKPGIVFVPDDHGLVESIAREAAPRPGGTMLTARMADGFAAGLEALADHPAVEVVSGDPSAAVRGRSATPTVLRTSANDLVAGADVLLEECFGPTTLLVTYDNQQELADAVDKLPGALTATVHAEPDEITDLTVLFARLSRLAGRIIFGGWPTGVTVGWAQNHGGPWPSTTSPLHTSVGARAIDRFLRPVTYQDVPSAWLPAAVQDDNPLGLPRRVDGTLHAG